MRFTSWPITIKPNCTKQSRNVQPLMSELEECCPHSLHLEQFRESRHPDPRMAPNQQERTKSNCSSMGSQQGTYIGQFADCICLHCDVVLLQLLLDLINALWDVFCLRKTNKNWSSFTSCPSFQHVGGEKQQKSAFASTSLIHTQLSKHLILTKLLIKMSHHNSATKPKVWNVSLVVVPSASPSQLHHLLQSSRFKNVPTLSCSMEIE